MIELPSDLHPSLTPLAFLLGTWQGAGVATLAIEGGSEEESRNVGQQLSFTHDGRDVLAHACHTWELDSDGNRVRPLESEHGYWRIAADRKIEAVLIRDQGMAEVWYGELADGKPQ